MVILVIEGTCMWDLGMVKPCLYSSLVLTCVFEDVQPEMVASCKRLVTDVAHVVLLLGVSQHVILQV